MAKDRRRDPAAFQPVYQRLNVKLVPDDERRRIVLQPVAAEVVRAEDSVDIATESEGATVVFIEGHDNPLIIQKTGGGYLYGTTDLAGIRTESSSSTPTGSSTSSWRGTHTSRPSFRAPRKRELGGNVQLEYAPFGSILGEDGKTFKSRSGESVKLDGTAQRSQQRA